MKYVLAFTVCLAILSCKNVYRSLDGRKTLVALQPLEHVPDKLLDSVAASIRQMYQFDVIILPKRDMPKDAFINVKSPRYRAEKLIAWLWKIKPDSADYIIGITQKDISTTKRDAMGRIREPKWKYEDWGIMGLGYCPGKSCVVSTFRL
jgi:archaemetzincin